MNDIIVGVDSTPASDRALDRTLADNDLAVRVVRVWSQPVWAGGGPGLPYVPTITSADAERYAAELLEESVAKALSRRGTQPAPTLTTGLYEGDAGHVLTTLSTTAALVVVGGRAHGPLAGALLGSVCNHLLHRAGSPVMVVPEEASPERTKRVVVGVDGSEHSRAALAWATTKAQQLGCPLVALHAWLINTPPRPVPYLSLPAGATYERDARAWLDTETAGRAGLVGQLAYGPAAGVLLDEAGPEDLLVVGARGHGGFAGLLLGSVAMQVAGHARGPVVVVR
jgi:nucleotide-binding universal stress UspA family protein